MNIKQCCTAAIIGICAMPAWGASMCVPDIKSASYSYTSTGTDAGNRGEFAIGKNCVSGTTLCRDTYVLGESHCSTTTIVTDPTWEDGGSKAYYCWCKFTHVRAPNGYLAPRSGAWVLSNDHGLCSTACAHYCANYGRTSPELRRALFASPAPLGGDE